MIEKKERKNNNNTTQKNCAIYNNSLLLQNCANQLNNCTEVSKQKRNQVTLQLRCKPHLALRHGAGALGMASGLCGLADFTWGIAESSHQYSSISSIRVVITKYIQRIDYKLKTKLLRLLTLTTHLKDLTSLLHPFD